MTRAASIYFLDAFWFFRETAAQQSHICVNATATKRWLQLNALHISISGYVRSVGIYNTGIYQD